MASPFSHAIAALSIGACFYQPQVPKRVWVAGVACSVIPDLDTIGFQYGIRYGDFWGHRGATHSLVFAGLLALIVALTLLRFGVPGIGRFSLFTYLFLATASHGILDAITNGGLGIAFFSPFDNNRYFLPWRPVLVSPITITGFFNVRGLTIIMNEAVWILFPALVFAGIVLALRRPLRTG